MTQRFDPELLSALPELYQPVYDHPEFDGQAQRDCQDRLDQVLAVHDALRQVLGRSLRVLDLGCAQGFFSLHLAAHGAAVEGIDSDPASIKLCQALAAEHPDLRVRFTQAPVEAALQQLAPDQYDLILGLSILHHLVHAQGADTVIAWLAHARRCVPVLILELARREDPLPWAAAQPEDPRQLVGDAAFIHQLGEHATHLTAIKRPLLLVSDSYWVLPPAAGPIDSHTRESHELSHNHYQGSRRYYRSGEYLIKYFDFDVPAAFDNPGELTREVQFLQQVPAGFQAPALIDHGIHDRAGWLIRQWWPGRLLLEELRQGPIADHPNVILAVLAQLANLEDAGLYHNDLRPWNLLRRDDGRVALIDYGAIISQPVDRAWPGSPHLALFILIHELTTGQVHHPEPLRPAAISPWGLAPPYRQWGAQLWDIPVQQWRFAHMRQCLQANLETPQEDAPPLLPAQRWIANLEQAVDIHGRTLAFLHWRHDQYSQQVSAVEARAWQSEAHARDSERRALDAEQRTREADHHRQQAEQRVREADHHRQQAEQQAQQAEQQAQQLQRQLQTRLRQAVQHQQQQQDQAHARIQSLEHELHELHCYVQHLAEAERVLRNSFFWRLTWPLRQAVDALRWTYRRLRQAQHYILHQLPRALAVGLLRRLARVIRAHPTLESLARRMLMRLPRLRQRLQRPLPSPTDAPATTATPETSLPPAVAWARQALQRETR